MSKKHKEPFVLSLDTRCNQRCLICMKKEAISQKTVLTFKEVSERIRAARKDGYTKIDFYGGEPLDYPFILRALRLADSLGFSCYLATNATKLSDAHFAHRLLSEIPLKEVRTTIHGHNASLHDRLTRVPGSFKKALTGIRRVLESKKTPLQVNVVINTLNYRHLSKIAVFLGSQGVKNVSFSGLTFEGEIRNNPRLFPELDKVRIPLDQAINTARKLKMRFRIIKLPACILKKRFRKKEYIVNEINGNFFKNRACIQCPQRTICPGIDYYQWSRWGQPSFL